MSADQSQQDASVQKRGKSILSTLLSENEERMTD